jgi:RNA polymerase sigma-70 factor, ECF subfamily
MIWDEVLPENCRLEENSLGQPCGQVSAMDEASFQAFYQEVAPTLRSYISRVCCDVGLADDILQESFYRFLRASSPNKDQRQWKAYLYRIATNLITDHWRQLQRASVWALKKGSDENAEDVLSHVEHRGDDVILSYDVNRILQKLKPVERGLLWLAYVEGAEHREIAAMLGFKEKSVRVLLFRARQKLGRMLRQRGFGEK